MRDFILKTFTDDEAETCQRCNMQELVRCRDCEDACICSDDWVICTHIDSNGNDKHPVDWFCADGKRRECVKPVTRSATDWDGVECE